MFTDLTSPLVEPLTLDDVKLFLRIDHTHEDNLLADLIRSARQQIERRANIILISRDIRVEIIMRGRCVRLPVRPVTALIALTHEGETVEATLASTTHAARVEISDVLNGPVMIDVTAGFGLSAEDVPIPLRQAMLLLVTDAYEHREREVGFERTSLRVDALIGPYWGPRL